MDIKRFIIDKTKLQDGTILFGLTAAIALASESKGRIVLITLTRRSISVSGEINDTTLENFRRKYLPKNIEMVYETIQTYKTNRDNDILVCVYLNQKDLEKLDDKMKSGAMIALEYALGDFDSWRHKWSPIDINKSIGSMQGNR